MANKNTSNKPLQNGIKPASKPTTISPTIVPPRGTHSPKTK